MSRPGIQTTSKQLSERDAELLVRHLDADVQSLLLNDAIPRNSEIRNLSDETDSATTRVSRTLCLRCHNLLHQNHEIAPAQSNLITDHQIFAKMRKEQNGIVLLVVDIYDFPFSLVRNVQQIIGSHRPIVLVVNKVDVLPNPDRHSARVQKWVREQCKQLGLPTFKNICLVSAKKGYGIFELINTIRELRDAKDDIYMVGYTNVGKSQVLNALLNKTKESSHLKVTSSKVPGTTIGKISVPLSVFENLLGPVDDKPRDIIDTPGIVNQQQAIHFLRPELLDTILPKQRVKPLNYRLPEGKTIFLGPFARIDVVEAEKPIIATVCSAISPHIVTTCKISTDTSHPTHDPKTLNILNVAQLPTLQPLPNYIQAHGDGSPVAQFDLALSGAGWIGFAGIAGKLKLTVWSPGGDEGLVWKREPALLPFEFSAKGKKLTKL
ncbi:hypothetical protein BZG36_04616 [Bifiguratus adelaidae]|uniref:G domain-containing protein n=1 Tax=Bifiguratus adelaidae TaxID=1938954 RepID=A0A261XX55_9FUNG|nr:hypothetical protein BZG36_04616 [Bifiguratus adelaidae]